VSVKDKIEREERPSWRECVERAAAQKSSLKGIFGNHAKIYSFGKSYPP